MLMRDRAPLASLRCGLATLGLLLALPCACARADFVVVPTTWAGREGNTWYNGFNESSLRKQTVISAQQFAGAGDAILIDGLSFRSDGPSGSSFRGTFPQFRIDLSTTQKTVYLADANHPDGIRQTFSENIGPDRATVYNGPLTLSSQNTGPAQGPKTFDVNIDFHFVFLYRPALGNLLLDLRWPEPAAGNIGTLDGMSDYSNPDFSSIAATTGFGGSDAVVADQFALGGGPVFRFRYVAVPPVPEPPALALLVLGSAFALGYRIALKIMA